MNDNLQDILFHGERILWTDCPDKLCFFWRSVGKMIPIAIIWLLFDGFFIVAMLATGAARNMWWFLIIFFVIHLAPVWSCIGKFIKAGMEHKNIVYAITDNRIIARNGVIGLDFENINYTDISNIRVDVSIIEKIRQVGSVFISTSSGKEICLMSVANPYAVYKDLNQVFVDVKTDIEYPNALRPDHNPGYQTQYKK